MTRYLPDNSAVSETCWESVMFAPVNAGLSQGVFGRRPEDLGTMTRLDPTKHGHAEYGARYSFQHAGLAFEADVQTHFGGAELRICAWVRSNGSTSTGRALCGSQLRHGFDVIASGWLEREKGFYLRGQASPRELRARQGLRPILRSCPVRIERFYVRPPVGGSMPWRGHA
jgi:hypothetical protein